MNWGHKILAVIILFVCAIGFMVYVASQQKNEMFDENYYEKELAYQSVINAKNNLAKEDEPIISQLEKYLEVKFDTRFISNIQNGKLEILRPSDQSKDIHAEIILDSLGITRLPLEQFITGVYKIRMSWTSSTIPYYYETKFYIN